MTRSHTASEILCAAVGAVGMFLALAVYCCASPPGALLPLCGDDGRSMNVLHLVALCGMAIATIALAVFDGSIARGGHIRSASLAIVAMLVIPCAPNSNATPFDPVLNALTASAAMSPGMLLGHCLGWILRSDGVCAVKFGLDREWGRA